MIGRRRGRLAQAPAAFAVLACLAWLSAGPAFARGWQSDAFRANAGRAERILLMPVVSSVVRARVQEAEPLFDESAELEAELGRKAAAGLRDLGYTVDDESAAAAKQSSDEALRAAVDLLDARLSEVMPQFSRRPKDIRTGRYGVGDGGLALARATGAEAALFVESNTVIPSKGRKALGAIFGGSYYQPTVTFGVGILVDLRSGVIDAVLVGQSLGAAVKRPGNVAQAVVTGLLAGHPRRGEALRVKAERLERAKDEREADLEEAGHEEEAVLADFQSVRAASAGAAAAAEPAQAEAPADPRPPAEVVEPARDFRPEQGGASEGGATTAPPPPAAAPAQSSAPPAPDPAPTPAPPPAPPPPPVPTPTPAPPGEDPEARALFAASAAPPSVGVSFAVGPGGPGVKAVNLAARDIRVSVGFGPFVALVPGAQARLDARPGTAWILVTDAARREIGRAACTVGADALVTVEVTDLRPTQ